MVIVVKVRQVRSQEGIFNVHTGCRVHTDHHIIMSDITYHISHIIPGTWEGGCPEDDPIRFDTIR